MRVMEVIGRVSEKKQNSFLKLYHMGIGDLNSQKDRLNSRVNSLEVWYCNAQLVEMCIGHC
jgi:hypothetical protein